MELQPWEGLLTTRQVCELTQLSRATLIRRRARGLFPQPLVLGTNQLRWLGAELRDWIAEQPRASSGMPFEKGLYRPKGRRS